MANREGVIFRFLRAATAKVIGAITADRITLGAATGTAATGQANATGYLVNGTAILTTAASEAEMEAGTAVDKLATPANLKHHPGVAKAWGTFAGATAVIPTNGSWNLTSATRNSSGQYKVTMTTAMANNDYVAIAFCTGNSINSGYAHITFGVARTTTEFTIDCVNGTNNVYDPTEVCVVVFGFH